MNITESNLELQQYKDVLFETENDIEENRNKINDLFKERSLMLRFKNFIIQDIKELEFEQYLITGKFPDES